jgi:uncharacterized protein YggE
MLPVWKEQPLMTVLVAALLVSASIFLLGRAHTLSLERKYIGRMPNQRDTITIEGEGKVAARPTLAQVSIGLYSEGLDVPTVQGENTRKVNAMIAALKDLSIADADLQTNRYFIAPKYDYKDGSQRVIGYTVSQNLEVKVRDLVKVGAVLSRVGQLGANQVSGVSFTIDDPASLKQEARRKALEDARAKAGDLAKTLDVEIIRVVTFSESDGTPPPMPYYRAEATVVPSLGPAPDVQAGALDIVSRVSVTYEIR